MTERRVERAKHLLSDSNLPLVEISARADSKTKVISRPCFEGSLELRQERGVKASAPSE